MGSFVAIVVQLGLVPMLYSLTAWMLFIYVGLRWILEKPDGKA